MLRNETRPRPVDEPVRRLRNALEPATELLLCLDFDGTLAPIVERPEDAAPTPEIEDALSTITAGSTVTTAIVSGRALADVRNRVDGPRIYAGNHGLELARGGSVAVHPVARKRAARVDRVCSALETALDPVPNCRIENKRLTGTVHFRSVPSALRPLVRRRTREVVDRFGGDELEVSPGKRILEIGPDVPWGKGNAVELIAANRPDGAATVYVGDDVTDESAFRAVEPDGVGIRVGDEAQTAASCRLRSPADVASLLEWIGSVGVERLEGTAGSRRDE